MTDVWQDSFHTQHCHVGNPTQHRRLGFFQDSDFAGDLEDSKSTSGDFQCTFGRRTFVPISWMCKKQTSVTHISTESDIISVDAGLRMDGFPALDLWYVKIEVLCSTNSTKTSTDPASGNRCETGNCSRNISKWLHVDHVPTNAHSSHVKSQLCIFEDNEAVIKLILKGRSPAVRHVSRTQRVAVD